jgi:hypothetical protein
MEMAEHGQSFTVTLSVLPSHKSLPRGETNGMSQDVRTIEPQEMILGVQA